ncbi:hypothetical protein [Streptomyces sp. NPDC048248]|uniref:hypothetical protein n=1 Tax=Streptomyces sp. NPDC048248 TaxID=3365523 RepID=UPI0037216DFE
MDIEPGAAEVGCRPRVFGGRRGGLVTRAARVIEEIWVVLASAWRAGRPSSA